MLATYSSLSTWGHSYTGKTVRGLKTEINFLAKLEIAKGMFKVELTGNLSSMQSQWAPYPFSTFTDTPVGLFK